MDWRRVEDFGGSLGFFSFISGRDRGTKTSAGIEIASPGSIIATKLSIFYVPRIDWAGNL